MTLDSYILFYVLRVALIGYIATTFIVGLVFDLIKNESASDLLDAQACVYVFFVVFMVANVFVFLFKLG